MRITYLHQYFNTPEMSGGTRSYEMARRLVAKGHEVNMVTSWRENDGRLGWFQTEEAGIKVHWLPVPYSNNMGYHERVWAFLRFAWGASRKAASLPADVVFATSTPLTIALPAVYAARRQKIPMVFEVRDLWPDVPIAMGALKSNFSIHAARSLEKFSYRNASHIVALAPTMRDFLSEKGVPLEKIEVIPNASDLEIFDPRSNKKNSDLTQEGASLDGHRVLLYCGGLGPAHGPQYIVKLAEELLRQHLDVVIVVVGEGRMRRFLEWKARMTGCLDRTICFKGSAPHCDVPQFYAQADASLMTMAPFELLYRHSVQNKFFDSLAAGKPVFANYAGWASDVAEQEGAGLILPRDDIAAAARILAEHLESESWLARAGKAARRLAEECFSRDRLAEQLEEVLLSATRK